MKPHLTMEKIEALRLGQLSPADLTEVAAHLQGCAECRRLADDRLARVTKDLHHDLGRVQHPDIEELFAYVDRTIDHERWKEIAEHVASCDQCREDAGDAANEQKGLRHVRSSSWWLIAAMLALSLTGAGIWWLSVKPAPSEDAIPHLATTPPPSTHEWDEVVANVRKAGRIEAPGILAELRGRSDNLRDANEHTPSLNMQPSGVVVASARPELTWIAGSGDHFDITIVCNDTVTVTGETGGRSWMPPRPLPRGANCVWQLERRRDHAVLPSPPQPQPMFRILDEATLTRIQQAKSDHADDFAIAILYARAGVRDEAVDHLRYWLSAHPRDETASRVLRDIMHW